MKCDCSSSQTLIPLPFAFLTFDDWHQGHSLKSVKGTMFYGDSDTVAQLVFSDSWNEQQWTEKWGTIKKEYKKI